MPQISGKQLSDLYRRAVAACRKEPNEEEFAVWKNVLSSFQASDIDRAVRTWQNDTTLEEFSGRPRGARMPMAAELKASIEQFERQQKAAASGNFIPCGRCEGGWVRIMHGVIARGEGCQGGSQIDPKIGALRRCQCWYDFFARRKSGVSTQNGAVA